MKAVVVSILNKNNMELFGNPEYKELTLVSILNKNNMELNDTYGAFQTMHRCQSLIRTIWNFIRKKIVGKSECVSILNKNNMEL